MAFDLAALFPTGVAHYALGGLLVGLGVLVIYAGTGLIVGASSVLETTLSFVSSLPRLDTAEHRETRGWRLVFTLGLVGGGAAYALWRGGGPWTTAVQPWRLLVGGTLVGAGTRLGKGCTSGHGICGLGSASRTSVVNVLVFLTVAVATAAAVAALGVTP